MGVPEDDELYGDYEDLRSAIEHAKKTAEDEAA
jgi:hypothetical protein